MLDILINNFVTFLFIFLRMLGMFIAAPLYGTSLLPTTIKILLSIFLAYIVLISLNIKAPVIELTYWHISFTAAKELIVGMMIGFFMQLIFWGVTYGASLMGFDLGLSMAQLFDPTQDLSIDVVSRLFNIFTILIFLLMNGHIFLVSAVYQSFKIIPISGFNYTKLTNQVLVKQAANVFIIAVKIASPIMVTFFLINIAEGIMSKIIPQMQVFFVLYPLRIGIGFLLISMSMVYFFYIIKELLKLHERNLFTLMRAMG